MRAPRAIRVKSSASSAYVPRVKKERDADDGGWNASPRSSALDPVSSQSYGFSRMKKQKHSVTGEDVRVAMRAVKEENSMQSLARSDGRYQFINPFLHEVIKRIVANIGMGGQVSLFILRHHAFFLSRYLLCTSNPPLSTPLISSPLLSHFLSSFSPLPLSLLSSHLHSSPSFSPPLSYPILSSLLSPLDLPRRHHGHHCSQYEPVGPRQNH